MEFQENPMDVKMAKISWGRNWSPIINMADKDSIILGSLYPMTTNAMNTPLAPIRQRTERKARMNLPPRSPSRGPWGRMVLIIP